MQQSVTRLLKYQRGMSFWGTIVVLAALVFIGTFLLKSIPAYVEYNSIRTAVKSIANASTSQLNRKEVIDAFNRQAAIDNIDSISGKDLRIEGNAIVAEYQIVIPMFANISILLDFNVRSSPK